MENILIVDNNLHIKLYPQKYLFIRLLNKKKRKIIFKRADALTDNDKFFDKIILTGSTSNVREERDWMKKEEELIAYWTKHNIPLLGICFGAQLIARTLFGKTAVKSMPIPISGSIETFILKESPLFDGLPKQFGTIATHYEGFILSDDILIAKTVDWKNYGFQIGNFIFGVQFHPELMNSLGKFIVRIQRLVYDRHIYQNFSVPVSKKYGKRILINFLNM